MRQALAATAVLAALGFVELGPVGLGPVGLGPVELGAATAGAATTPMLPGTYVTTISGKKPAVINGEWAIEMRRSGAYVILKRINKTQGRVEVRGKAVLNPKHVVEFTKETGPLACRATGRYRWALSGSRLTFVRLHDTCSGRRVVLGGRFTRVA